VLSRRVNLSRFITLATLLLVLLGTVTNSSSAADESEPPLLTLQQFCKMDRLDVAKRSPVRLRGTVTFINRKWQFGCIQEADCAVKLFMEADVELEAGQLVEVTGRPEFGDFRNILMLTEAQVIGKGTELEPVQLDSSQAFSLDTLYRWSEFEGDIYSAVQDEDRFYLAVAGPEFGVYIMLPKRPEFPPLSEIRNSRIRLGGVPVFSSQQTAPWRIDLHAPEGGLVKITPSVAKKDQPRLRYISLVWKQEMRDGAEAPIRIRAVVRAVSGKNRFFISDESGHLMVTAAERSEVAKLSPGDVVEVEGLADRSLEKTSLKDAIVRYVGKGYSKPPVQVTAIEAKKHLAELIEIEGLLVTSHLEKNWLLLRDGGSFFRVRYRDNDHSQLEQLQVGSTVRVSGGCWLSDNNDAYFDIYAETASVPFSIPTTDGTDESPAQRGSSGTKTIPAAAPTILDIMRPILLTLLLIFLGTLIYLVNRRLREQEKFQESIHEQLSNLSHIARLNTLSEMVGALAHELNQPLASVSNYAATAELLSKKEPTGSEKLSGVLTSIGQEAFRAGEIIRRLRHLVRKKTPGSLPVHISEIIRETVELFKTQHVTASGLVQTEIADDLPTVQADSVQIQQVVLNLLLNAREATEAQSDRPPAIQVETRIENAMVYVSVSDNGIGIASSTPDAIFEPYFTTRENGTGLGLAISRTIIETHGGTITAENGSPFGTRITFSLPVSRSQANIAG